MRESPAFAETVAAVDYAYPWDRLLTDLKFHGALDLSLVGNVVLRWEYRPGSTVFLVWQRRQSDQATVGNFDFGRDVGALFDAPSDNRFIVKVSYWLGM